MLKMRATSAMKSGMSGNRYHGSCAGTVPGLQASRSRRHSIRYLSANAAEQRPTWVTTTATVSTSNAAEPVRDQAAASSVTLTSADSATNNELFNWFSWLWPVSPVNMLDRQRPTQHVLLGKEFVVWYSSKEDKWSMFEDRCPHRLAPLSQGRIMDGELQCSYHGWQWDTQGVCTKIPQATDTAQDTACSNQRSCTSSYPVMIHQGILYAWLDNSPQGLESSKSRGIAQAPVDNSWYLSQMGTDYVAMLEQGMDPQHSNFRLQGLEMSKRRTIAQANMDDSWYMSQVGTDYLAMLTLGMDPQHANFLHVNSKAHIMFKINQDRTEHANYMNDVQVVVRS